MSVVRSRVLAPMSLNSAARIGVLGLAMLGAGCASQQTNTAYPGERLGGPPPRVASAPKIEIEDDGLPAQIAPRERRPVVDDPSEPWSPNYGGSRLERPATAPAARSANIAPARPIGSVAPSTRLSALDEEEVIRRAVAEHEMRRGD